MVSVVFAACHLKPVIISLIQMASPCTIASRTRELHGATPLCRHSSDTWVPQVIIITIFRGRVSVLQFPVSRHLLAMNLVVSFKWRLH